MEKITTTIKKGTELTSKEIAHIDNAKSNAWGVGPIDEEQKKELFVLIKYKDSVVAHGQMLIIKEVKFQNEQFEIVGIGGIISNERGKGFGRLVMQAIKDYLIENKIPGVGFTNIPDFYKKCGFEINKELLSKFVHKIGEEKMINREEETCFYFDNSGFIPKILSAENEEVFLPRDPDW